MIILNNLFKGDVMKTIWQKTAFLGILSLGLLSNLAMAREDRFESHKEKILKNMDEKISNLQSARGCIANTKEPAGIGTCMKSLQENMKKEREERIDHQIDELKERKARLEKSEH